jgi:hypothetical protein
MIESSGKVYLFQTIIMKFFKTKTTTIMKMMKLASVGLIALTLVVFFACKKSVTDPSLTSAAKKTTQLDAPTVACSGTVTGASITLSVTAGTSGAPAGFTVQWMKKSDYDTYGWSSNTTSPSYCAASFSGVPSCSNYNLVSGASIQVTIGDEFDACGASGGCGDLLCGTDYVFRVFAHNDPVSGAAKSNYSNTATCSTAPCGGQNCTYTQGYWKTHGPVGCATGNNTDQWFDNITTPGTPVQVTSLTIGTVTYTDLQICTILNTPAGGNGLISLAHQLIAAKLNVVKGSDASSIQSSIDAADALIGSLVIPPVGGGSLAPSSTSSLVTALTNYNEGLTGPGHCSN